MNKEQRRKASVDLSQTYLSRYYADWRLAKLLMIKKVLNNRYDFYKDIISEVKQFDDPDGEATIAQEIQNGLYFDAIAICIQYIEDLFALMKASQTPDYFIRNIITYNAGQVTNTIKTYKPSIDNLSKAFHFPLPKPFADPNMQSVYDRAVVYLGELMTDITTFYKNYEFFYIQYKHGLTVAMRPYGIFGQELIDNDKKGGLEPYLAVYDNMNLPAAGKRGTFSTMHGVIMPGFTDNVRPFISELSNENNFLRLVFSDDLNIDIDRLVDVGRKIRACLHTLISNFSLKLSQEPSKLEFQLPDDYKTNKYAIFTVEWSEN